MRAVIFQEHLLMLQISEDLELQLGMLHSKHIELQLMEMVWKEMELLSTAVNEIEGSSWGGASYGNSTNDNNLESMIRTAFAGLGC